MAVLVPVLAACAQGQPSSISPERSAESSIAPSATSGLPEAPSFTALQPKYLPAGHPLLAPAVGDLNEDGNADVVTTTYTPGQGVLVLLGNGDGTFEQAADTGVARANVVRVADFDADGHLDLLAANDRLIVLLGLGDGTFQTQTLYDVGIGTAGPDPLAELWISWLAVADLNGDGVLDALAADYVRNELAILEGRGDGTFLDATFVSCPKCATVAAADLDGDGDVDVATTSFQPGGIASLSVHLNLGGGTLYEPWSVELPCPVAIDIADLNSDGARDLATGNDACGSSSVLFGNGDGTFADEQSFPAGNCHAIAVVDLDGDGDLDFLTGSYEHTTLWFWRGNGDGTLGETQGIEVTPNVGAGMAVADFNNDGRLDLVLTYSGSKGAVGVALAR